MGADVSSGTTDRRHHLLPAPDAEALGGPRMGGTRVGDVLCALPAPNGLRAADVRDAWHATEHGRGPIDNGRRALERIRHDTGHPESGMVGLERLKPAQGEWCFRGIRGSGRWWGGPLVWGDTVLLEGLVLLLPHPELRGRRREDKAHGDGDLGGHSSEKDEAVSPQRATTCFIAPFREIGKGLGRL